MLCTPKKNGTLHTIVVYCQQNANTIKDVTLFPDQDNIQQDVAHHKYRSKFDMSDMYEQIRNESRDVWKTAFVNVFGAFISNVMMQGNCNTPAMFQRVMTLIFCDLIGRWVHVYLDDCESNLSFSRLKSVNFSPLRWAVSVTVLMTEGFMLIW